MKNRFPENELEGLRLSLSQPHKIVITTHHKPDGDAMGSSLGLYHYLSGKGHRVSLVIPNDFPDFLQWMPGTEAVIDYEKAPSIALEEIESAEMIFCLDFNSISRLEKFGPVIGNAKADKVLIDHHLDPENIFKHSFSYTESCATSELIYEFIVAMGDKHLINKSIAECLYTGIMTDTASFRFASMLSDTHRIIAELMDAGAENHQIHEAVYDNSSEERLRFLGYCLGEKLKVLPEYHTAFISISKEELSKFKNKTGDTEGIVNYGLGIKGISFAAFFAERQGIIKISFRSKNNFSAKDFANKHFEGGGHKNAAGGKSSLSLEDTIKKFIALLPEYKEKFEE
jgi:phosphoesterase RecJ-like protein